MSISIFSLWIVFVFLLLFIAWKYLRFSFKRRFIKPLNLNPKTVYLFDFLFIFISFFRTIYRLQLESFASPIWVSIFYVDLFLFGLIGYVSISLFTWDIIEFIYSKVNHIKVEEEFNIDRRNFLKKNLSLVAMSSVSVGASVVAATGCIECPTKDVEIIHPRLPKNLEGLKIAQITDLHVGATIKRDYLEAIVEKINAKNPDIIALTGDMVDGTVEFLKDELEALKNLKSKYGVYFVSGNHEYYWGINSWLDFYKNLGVNVLNNENKVLNINDSKFLIGGVSDFGASRFNKEHNSSPEKAMGGLKKEVDFSMLLAHRPKSVVEAQKAGFDFQISGHTHGGQSFPYNLIVSVIQKYFKGFYWHKDTALYVSTGAGYWGPPVRLGVPSEVCIYTLKSS